MIAKSVDGTVKGFALGSAAKDSDGDSFFTLANMLCEVGQAYTFGAPKAIRTAGALCLLTPGLR